VCPKDHQLSQEKTGFLPRKKINLKENREVLIKTGTFHTRSMEDMVTLELQERKSKTFLVYMIIIYRSIFKYCPTRRVCALTGRDFFNHFETICRKRKMKTFLYVLFRPLAILYSFTERVHRILRLTHDDIN
jgi:hypothetical protein